MAQMFEGGGYENGILQLSGHCKKCKCMKMVEVDVSKNNITEQLYGTLCERFHEQEFGIQAQRDKKLEALFASKKKWWEFWKD